MFTLELHMMFFLVFLIFYILCRPGMRDKVFACFVSISMIFSLKAIFSGPRNLYRSQ